MVQLTTFNDLECPLTRISRSRHFLKSNIGKPARLKDKVTIAQEETIPNIWNGTIFGDLD